MVRPIASRLTRAAFAFVALAAAAVLVLGGLGTPAARAGKKLLTSADKVMATAKATTPDASGKQVVTVTLTIDKGWHLYANPAGFDLVEPAKTEVTITGKAKPRSVKVEYPPGTPHKDEDLKGTYNIYEGQVTIRAVVQRAAGDAGPLQVAVRVNACDATKCLAPGKIELKVP
jgi:DsbC/DsbD-like thiol-disulfide interchange protein